MAVAPFTTGGLIAKYGNSMVGQSLQRGFAENFGWWYEGFGQNAVNRGFLGHRMLEAEIRGSGASAVGRIGGARGLARAVEAGGIKGVGRGLIGTAGRMAGPAMTAYMMYQGYKEGGVLGAMKEASIGVAFQAGFHYLGAAIGGFGTAAAVAAPFAVAGAAALGTYALGQAGRKHARGLRHLEMGQQDQIQAAIGSAGAATMRQRSLMALNNTHLNSRMALGNEGFLMHRSFA